MTSARMEWQQPPVGADLFAGDPYPRYRELRQRGPIHWSDELFGGAWVLTTFEGVRSALRDVRLSAQRTGGWLMRDARAGSTRRRRLVDMQRLFARALLFVDKPSHPRLRRALQAGFHPVPIQKLHGFVRQAVTALLDRIEATCDEDAPFDFIEQFARVLPAQVIARFLGLHDLDPAQCASWASTIATFLGSVQPDIRETLAARDSILAIREYLEQHIRRAEFDDDSMLGALRAAQQRGDIESDVELLSQSVMLLFAGHETTRHLLGTAVYWLLQEPVRWQSLQDQVSVRSAVLELLRWDSPIQYTGRRATRSFMLMGQHIRRGDLILPLIGSANRDPARFDHPERIDLGRQVGVPLSFGAGPHVCLGVHLTLMEAECAIVTLIERWPNLCMADPSPRWVELPLYRGLRALMVRRCPARADG